jgi:hypothetical protein
VGQQVQQQRRLPAAGALAAVLPGAGCQRGAHLGGCSSSTRGLPVHLGAWPQVVQAWPQLVARQCQQREVRLQLLVLLLATTLTTAQR